MHSVIEVSYGVKKLIDASISESKDTKIPEELYDFIEQIALNGYTWGSTRSKVKPPGVRSIDTITAMELRLVGDD